MLNLSETYGTLIALRRLNDAEPLGNPVAANCNRGAYYMSSYAPALRTNFDSLKPSYTKMTSNKSHIDIRNLDNPRQCWLTLLRHRFLLAVCLKVWGETQGLL